MNSTKLEIAIILDCGNPISSLVGALNPPMARFSFEQKEDNGRLQEMKELYGYM